MRIEIKGRNLTVSDELNERVEKKLAKIGRQVSELAEMEIELMEERNPSIREACASREATLHPKGTTIRACERSDDMPTRSTSSRRTCSARSSATATSAAAAAGPPGRSHSPARPR